MGAQPPETIRTQDFTAESSIARETQSGPESEQQSLRTMVSITDLIGIGW